MDEFGVIETENSAEVTTNSFPLKFRKRMRYERNRARNDGKNEIWGLAYLNSKNVFVDGKTHQLIDKCCHDLGYQKFSKDQQKNIFHCYYKISNFD